MKTKKSFLKVIAILLFCTLPTVARSADEETKTDLLKLELKGKVKSVTQTVKVLSKGSSTGSDGMYKSKQIFQFNEQGYKTEIVIYNIEQKIEQKQLIKYNTANKITEITNYNGNNELVYKEQFQYNDKNKETEHLYFTTRKTPDRKLSKIYDANGNLIEVKEYGSNMKLKNRITSVYNSKNLETENVYFDPLNNVLTTIKYTYNAFDKVSEEFQYLSDGSLYTKSVYEYNNNKDVIKLSTFHVSGVLMNQDNIEYNKAGLMTEKTHFEGNVCTVSLGYKYNSKGLVSWEWDRKKREYTDYAYDANQNNIKVVVNDDFSEQYRIIRKYVYDANNNWVSMLEDNSKEVMSLLTTREISYY